MLANEGRFVASRQSENDPGLYQFILDFPKEATFSFPIIAHFRDWPDRQKQAFVRKKKDGSRLSPRPGLSRGAGPAVGLFVPDVTVCSYRHG